MQVNRSNDMKVIDNKYIISDKELKNKDLKVGGLYADMYSGIAAIMRLVKIDESTLEFQFVAGEKVYLTNKVGTLCFSNIDYSPWFEVNDLQSTNK